MEELPDNDGLVGSSGDATPKKPDGGVNYCCCGCGEPALPGYRHKLPSGTDENIELAREWIAAHMIVAALTTC